MKNAIWSTLGKAVLMLLAGLLSIGFVLYSGWRLAHRLGLGGKMIRTTGAVVRLIPSREGTDTFDIEEIEVLRPSGDLFVFQPVCPPFDGCFGDWFGTADIGDRVPVTYPGNLEWQLVKISPAGGLMVMADTIQGWLSDIFVLLFGLFIMGVAASLRPRSNRPA